MVGSVFQINFHVKLLTAKLVFRGNGGLPLPKGSSYVSLSPISHRMTSADVCHSECFIVIFGQFCNYVKIHGCLLSYKCVFEGEGGKSSLNYFAKVYFTVENKLIYS